VKQEKVTERRMWSYNYVIKKTIGKMDGNGGIATWE
jgi:hypothetical protein